MPGRILLVGPYPPPYGGIASQIANTAPLLLEGGFERVHVLASAKTDELSGDDRLVIQRIDLARHAGMTAAPQRWWQSAGALATMARYRLPARKAVAETVRLAAIRDLLRRHRYDIVHFFMLNDAPTAPVLRRLEPRLKIVLTIYGEIFDDEGFFRPRARLVREELAAVDACLSSSRHCARSVELLGLSSDRIEPLYYGVDLDHFSPRNDPWAFREKAGISASAKMVFFLGRLNDEMGADVVADVIPDVIAARDDAVFVVAGADGTCVPRLRDLETSFPGRVVLRVNVPGDQLPGMYAACDLLLAPTRDRHACMGMSIKEAMATGRVGICSRSGGIPEAVTDGETGVLLPTDSDLRVAPADLTRAILGLLGDDQRRTAMGQAARRRAELMFDNRRTAARLVEIYQGLLANP